MGCQMMRSHEHDERASQRPRQVPLDGWLMPLGVLGLVAGLGVGTGEFLVHYTGGVPVPEVPFGFMRLVPIGRLTLGHFLIVAFMPLYILGYGHLYIALRPAGEARARAVWVLGVFALTIGGMWVGSRGFLGHLAHLFDEPGLRDHWAGAAASYTLLLENLLHVLRVLMVGISAVFAWGVLGGKSMYPRWMALLSPALLVAIFLSSQLVWPAAGALFVPAAMNLAHAGLFGTSVLVLGGRPAPRGAMESQA